VKEKILHVTGYSDRNVETAIQADQFMVTVINSRLNKATPRQREGEASKIVDSIARSIAGQSKFARVLGIHINYVERGNDEAHTEIVDGIDFRKNPQGHFVHHTT
jgi:hypothetical protein